MGFDKDDPRPLMDVKKRTTKVNLLMVVAILGFLVVAGVVTVALWRHPAQSEHRVVPTP